MEKVDQLMRDIKNNAPEDQWGRIITDCVPSHLRKKFFSQEVDVPIELKPQVETWCEETLVEREFVASSIFGSQLCNVTIELDASQLGVAIRAIGFRAVGFRIEGWEQQYPNQVQFLRRDRNGRKRVIPSGTINAVVTLNSDMSVSEVHGTSVPFNPAKFKFSDINLRAKFIDTENYGYSRTCGSTGRFRS